MRKLFLASLTMGTLLLLLGGPAGARVDSAAETTRYVVAFGQPNGLPASADRLVVAAGGTIVARAPQIGAVLAESSRPDFAERLAASDQVRAVDLDVMASVPDPESLLGDPTADGHVDGGQASPTGPDPQPGTEPLYNQQWDKMRVNASATGSYAIQRGRRDVVVAVLDPAARRATTPACRVAAFPSRARTAVRAACSGRGRTRTRAACCRRTSRSTATPRRATATRMRGCRAPRWPPRTSPASPR